MPYTKSVCFGLLAALACATAAFPQQLPPESPDDVCARIAAQGLVEGEPQPDKPESPLCGIESPILLKALVLESGARVEISPPALVNCPMAAAVARWVRSSVQPQLAKDNLQLVKLEIAGAYECRGRNRVAGAKLSEHATGNALDIRAFITFSGRRFDITKQSADLAFFQALKISACAQFSTDLGPGSDGYHQDHLHLDLQHRNNGSHFCQWVVE